MVTADRITLYQVILSLWVAESQNIDSYPLLTLSLAPYHYPISIGPYPMSRYPKKVMVGSTDSVEAEEPTDSELLAESIIDNGDESDEINDVEPTIDTAPPDLDAPPTPFTHPTCPKCNVKAAYALWPTPGTHEYVRVCAYCGNRPD